MLSSWKVFCCCPWGVYSKEKNGYVVAEEGTFFKKDR